MYDIEKVSYKRFWFNYTQAFWWKM